MAYLYIYAACARIVFLSDIEMSVKKINNWCFRTQGLLICVKKVDISLKK